MKARVRIVMESPCTDPDVRFEEREGGRFCLSCQKPQFDLREATEREARALFARHDGALCGRFRVAPSGALRFRPEPPARQLGALVALTLAACGGETAPETPPPTTTVELELPPPPTTVVALPPPPTTEAVVPPPTTTVTTPDSVASASGVIDHSLDDSTDPNDHSGHWHRHPPVIGGSGGRHSEIHGGARAHFETDPGDPLNEL